jgi:hypothetical protein
MPSTAATLRVNAWSPSDNLRGTSQYLKTLLDRFHGKRNGVELAIAGYNAGPKAVEKFHGVPPYAETQSYVVRVLHVWNQLNARIGSALRPGVETIAVRAQKLPDEQQWLTDTNSVLPETAAALDALRPSSAAAVAPVPTIVQPAK